MKLRADFGQRVVVFTNDEDWIASPQAGVERKMLDRVGDEVARATSLVRYAKGSAFEEHDHALGEEFFVLEGVFSDGSGDYPAGTYVRNPPGSKHRPFSRDGCVILVKLRQMAETDKAYWVSDSHRVAWQRFGEGLFIKPLFEDEITRERVHLLRFDPGAMIQEDRHPEGQEVFVLEGVLEDEDGQYPRGTWIRFPAGSCHSPFSKEGCILWVKRNHLSTK